MGGRQDFFTRGRVELAEELMPGGYVNHDPPAGRGRTREDVTVTAARFHQQLGDFAATIDRIIAQGDLVAVHGTISWVTQSGEHTQIRLAEFFRVDNGRGAERWG